MLKLEDMLIRQGDFTLTADLAIPPGLTAVIGPSGGGKSTLLAAIAGFVLPERGRITWMGQDISAAPPAARPVSVLFQDNNLFPHLTIAQNLGLALSPRLRLTDAHHRRIDEALDRVGLGGLGTRKPASLSGGQQGRAGLARVLLADRPVVLLDEPFAALGPALRDEMLALVRTELVDAGRTVLMVTHDPRDAGAVAPRTILVAEGTASGPHDTEALFADPPPALSAYLGRSSRLS